MTSWTLCSRCDSQETYDQLRALTTRKNDFLKCVEEFGFVRWRRAGKPKYVPCDELAMMCALDPECIVQQEHCAAVVECHGQHTKGQVVVDRRWKENVTPNVNIVFEINAQTYLECLYKARE